VGKNNAANVLPSDTVAAAEFLHVGPLCLDTGFLQYKVSQIPLNSFFLDLVIWLKQSSLLS
jgi:hypothetical protein